MTVPFPPLDGWHALQLLALALGRPAALLLVLPLLRPPLVPGLVRHALLLSLALPLLPALTEAVAQPLALGAWLLLLLKEVLLGLMLGVLAALLFWAAFGAGLVIDVQRGAALASALDPQFDEQGTPLGTLLGLSLAAWVFVSGGFLLLLDALYRSYQLWPLASRWPRLEHAAGFFLAQFDYGMHVTALLALPAVALMLLVESALALFGRSAPRLNVFVLALPLKSAAALLVLVLTLGALLRWLEHEWRGLYGLLRALSGALQP